jgi:hypothetical protein
VTKKGYTLYRLHADGATKTLVSKHASLAGGFSAGQDAVHADREHAYVLYLAGPCERRVARFAFSRIMRAVEASPGLEAVVIS